ncbi:MAG: reverse transcriptase/maturase family protein [Candidatus Ornithomonoglobus sp.]
MEFENELMYNIMKLKIELEEKIYSVGGYKSFKVYEPKEREIMALSFRDRIVQHSLCDNVLEPFLDARLDYDNAACRKGKGTHFALDRLKYFLQKGYNKWGSDYYILKCDIRKYFYNINHDILKKNLYRFIGDEDLIRLLDVIIDSTDGNVGLPIGNMTSQWFAIFYLDKMDRFIRNELRIKLYSRYMDDFILIHNNKDYLKECLDRIRAFLDDELALELNEKTQIFPVKNGVDYLGFHTYITETGKVIRKIRRKSKAAMKRKIKKFNIEYSANNMEYERIHQSIASWIGHAKHGDTFYLRKNIIKKLNLQRSNDNEEKTDQSAGNSSDDYDISAGDGFGGGKH